jgi:methylated-DNA-[protein]-cysteine S-methyltransferase
MRVFETPVGWMALAATARGLARLVLPGEKMPPADEDAPGDVLADRLAPADAPQETARAEAIALRGEREVREYLDGRRRRFTVPVDLEDVPPFRRRVLRAALRIPYGRTVSYAELARRSGSPRGARAVGQAMATNPVPLVIPCHRVLATGGGLGGYGGGLDLKRYLLALEGVQLRNGTEKTA